MRVTLVGAFPSPNFPPMGGVEAVVASLVPHLAKAVELSVVVPAAPFERRVLIDGVPVHYVKRTRGPGPLRYWSTDAVRVAKAVRAQSPDLIHVQGPAGTALLVRGVPQVLTIHGIAHRDIQMHYGSRFRSAAFAAGSAWLVKVVERVARARAEGIIIINPYVLDELPDTQNKRSRGIPNPVHDSFRSQPVPDSTRVRGQILIAGKISHLKNTLAAIECFKEIAGVIGGLRLVIAGEAQSTSYLDACLVAASANEDRIHFVGNLDRRQLIRELDRSAALLLLSRQENAPMVIAEAHCRGVPVVASRVGGIAHMIKEGVNGRLVDPKDISAAAQAVIEMFEAPVDSNRIIQEARKTYSAARIAAATVSFYRDIL